MRITVLFPLLAVLFSGCIIVGEMPKGTLDDTGEPYGETEPFDEDRRFLVTPSEVTPDAAHAIVVSSKPALEANLVVDLVALDGATVDRFMPTENGLAATISVPPNATPGPVTLVLEYADGEVDIIRDGLAIIEPLPEPEDDEDTAAPADQQPE